MLPRRRLLVALAGLAACRPGDGRGGRRPPARERVPEPAPASAAPIVAPAIGERDDQRERDEHGERDDHGEPHEHGERDDHGEPRDHGEHDDDDVAIDLWLAGDLHLGEGGPEVVDAVRELVPAGALGFVNLEGPIGEPAEPGATNLRGGPVLINGPRAPAILRGLGVEIVGVANNHADDRCEIGKATTARALRRAGVAAVDAVGETIVERGGLRLAFTADFLDPAPLPGLAERLARARARADHLIATFHVDGPPSYLPSAELRAAVEVALAAGASAIVAHGSHAIARVESRGDAVIAWGLGNLAFACACTDEVDGAILGLRLGRRRILGATWTPIAAGLGGGPVARHPEPELLFELLRSLKSTPGIADGDRLRLEIGPFAPAS